eukprot:1897508-Rhodomonas_salina.2
MHPCPAMRPASHPPVYNCPEPNLHEPRRQWRRVAATDCPSNPPTPPLASRSSSVARTLGDAAVRAATRMVPVRRYGHPLLRQSMVAATKRSSESMHSATLHVRPCTRSRASCRHAVVVVAESRSAHPCGAAVTPQASRSASISSARERAVGMAMHSAPLLAHTHTGVTGRGVSINSP